MEIPNCINPHEAVNPLGVDLGIALAVATSAGQAYRPPNQRYLENRVKEARRHLSAVIGANMATGQAGYRAVLDETGNQMLSSKGRPSRELVWVNGQPTKSYLTPDPPKRWGVRGLLKWQKGAPVNLG